MSHKQTKKMPLKALENIHTPAYVADIKRIQSNLSVVARIKKETGCKVMLATKAFAMPAVFPYMRDVLDGTTASGPYEAKLGATHFGKEVHTYSPAYSDDELNAALQHSKHIYFNSVAQLKKFALIVRGTHADATIGLRVNPQLSLVKNSALYDPSTPDSRFGVQVHELTDDVLENIDTLHIHNLCENMAEDSVRLIQHVSDILAEPLKHVRYVNFGGGHYITHPDYDVAALIEAINQFQQQHDVKVILEPGGALVYDAGYLVTKVLDVFENSKKHAIIDASASAHMPDVLEVPYRPNIVDAKEAGVTAHSYVISGTTCMTGDVVGEYSFDAPLEVGQTLIFTDMMQYSFVKNTNFNGVPMPDLGMLYEDGSYELVKQFSYKDFADRLG